MAGQWRTRVRVSDRPSAVAVLPGWREAAAAAAVCFAAWSALLGMPGGAGSIVAELPACIIVFMVPFYVSRWAQRIQPRAPGYFWYRHPLKAAGFCLSVNYATNCGIYVAAATTASKRTGIAGHAVNPPAASNRNAAVRPKPSPPRSMTSFCAGMRIPSGRGIRGRPAIRQCDLSPAGARRREN